MDALPKILLVLSAVDLVVFPFYMVWIIRRGNHYGYDFQQFHRVFTAVELFLFGLMAAEYAPFDLTGSTVLAMLFATIILHNLKDVHKYLISLRRNFFTLVMICEDLVVHHAFIAPDDYDVGERSFGRRWGFMNYMAKYGVRFACDILVIATLLVFFV